MVKSANILDYQARQTAEGVEVDAVAIATVDPEELSGHLAEALAAAGLRNPAVSVRIVDRLERHPDSGKLNRFVPLRA
jgi:hypothetical protein